MKTSKETLQKLGFRFGSSGVHTSRTMMGGDLELLLSRFSPEKRGGDIAALVEGENLLGKKTGVTRSISLQKLRSLYGLDPGIPLFRVFLSLWKRGPSLVTVSLVARARDPLFASTYSVVAGSPPGTVLGAGDFESSLRKDWGDVFKDSTLRSASRNVSSSWTQAGYLEGDKEKRRRHPPAALEPFVLALWLAYAEGFRDGTLLDSPWVRSLEVDREIAEGYLTAAHRAGLVVYRNAGGIREIRLEKLFTPGEREMLDVST